MRFNNTVILSDSDDVLTVSMGKLGKYFAVAGKTKTLRIYNQSNNKIIAKFNNFKTAINSVKLSSD